MSGWDDPISVVEDLDPEPEQPPGRPQLRDLILGLVLLVGVLGFAGWQWWSQESRQSSYARAVEALSRNRLDEAHALFAGASGYRDADSRAADVGQRIAQRDSLYTSATNRIAARDWAAALADLRALRAIQPMYQASSHLERLAVVGVARQTLDHSVAVREPPDGPAGLYYHHDAEWVYLPQSDLDSRVRGSGVADTLVYDVPGEGSERRLMLARFNDREPVTTRLPFDPAVYEDFRWGEHGLWAFRFGRYATTGTPPVRNALHGVDVAYMRYSSPVTRTIDLARNSGGDQGEMLVGVDSASDRYLMASWSEAERWTSNVLSDTVTHLYLGTAGGERKLIYSLRSGMLDGAQLSSGGRFVLISTRTPSPGGMVYGLALLDLETRDEPQPIDGVRARSTDDGINATRWVASTFIESGAYAGKILAAVYNFNHTHLRIIDPAFPEEPLLDVEVPGMESLQWAVPVAGDRGLVVSGWRSSYSGPYDRGDTQSMPTVQISPRGQVTQTGVLVERHGFPYLVDLAPDHLAILSVAAGPNNRWTAYTVPASALGKSTVHPTVVYTQSVQSAVDFGDAVPVSAGGGLLIYVDGGTLRARTYDGAVDVALEEGVRALHPRRYLHDRYPSLR